MGKMKSPGTAAPTRGFLAGFLSAKEEDLPKIAEEIAELSRQIQDWDLSHKGLDDNDFSDVGGGAEED